jgi:hypothetical protein
LHGAAGSALGVVAVGKASGVLVTSGLVKWGVVVTALAAAGVAGKVVVTRVSTGADRAPSAPTSSTSVVPQRVATARASVVNAPGTSSRGALAGATPVPGASASDGVVAEATPVPAASATDGAVAVAPVPRAQSAASAFALGTKAEPKTSRSSRTLAETPSVANPSSVATPSAVDALPADTEQLAEQVALVDRARGALANGDAPGALAALNQYDAQFARRKFAPESLYLRMEALLREGRTSAARDVAQMLVQSYSTSPHAARARQVLAQTTP